MKLISLLILAASLSHAGVVLNTPDPNSGFFDGYSNYFDFDGTGKIASVSSAALPEANGLASQKVYGSAFLANGDYDPYIVMVAWGTASGTFATDTIVSVSFKFAASSNAPEYLPYYIQGELGTAEGYYYTEYSDSIYWGTQGTTDPVSSNFKWFIPAGVEVTGWRVSLGLGEYGHTSDVPFDLTLTIPANSVELTAFPYGDPPAAPTPPLSDVPEPATCALTAAGIALLLVHRLRHPV